MAHSAYKTFQRGQEKNWICKDIVFASFTPTENFSHPKTASEGQRAETSETQC